MSEPQFTSALAHLKGKDNQQNLVIELEEISDRGMIDLRGMVGDMTFLTAVEKALGMELPLTPRTSTVKGEVRILWLSIDQWLVCCANKNTTKLVNKLTKALQGIHSLVVDLSDARTIIRLKGNDARVTLMKAAPVDLTAHDITQGHIRRLRFGEIAAMVHIVDCTPDVIDLYVFRSYGDFAWHYLLAIAGTQSRVQLFGPQAVPV